MVYTARIGKILAIIVNVFIFHAVEASDTVLVDYINLPFHIKTLASDSNGTIWISGGNGLFYFKDKELVNKETRYNKHIISDQGKVKDIEEYYGDIDRDIYYPWHLFENWQKFIPGNYPYLTAGRDKQGRFWVANGNNIFIFELEERFTKRFEDYSTRGIFQDEYDNLYLNTYQGILKNGLPLVEFPEMAEGYIERVENELYFAWAGIIKYNPHSGERKIIKIEGMHPNGAPVGNSIVKVSMMNDTLWAATGSGLGLIQNDSLLIVTDSINIEDIHFSDDTGRFLIATYGNGIMERVGTQIFSVNLPKYHYHQILFHENKYYLTSDQGLVIWDGKGQYEIIRQEDGLSNCITYSALFDDSNFLWVSTITGLNRINLKTGVINQYLLKTEFNKRSYLKHGELLYFGSVSGLFQFTPEAFIGDDIMANSKTNNVYLIFSIVFCFLLLLASLLWKSKKKKKTENKEVQLRLIEKQFFLMQIESFIIKSKTPVSVQTVADYLEVSERQLYRIFKEYDTTPGRFIKEAKLEKAKLFIENNHINDLEKIAKHIGYSKPYFRKLFNDEKGVKAKEKIQV